MDTVEILRGPFGDMPMPDWLRGVPMTKDGMPRRNTRAGRDAYRKLWLLFHAQQEEYDASHSA